MEILEKKEKNCRANLCANKKLKDNLSFNWIHHWETRKLQLVTVFGQATGTGLTFPLNKNIAGREQNPSSLLHPTLLRKTWGNRDKSSKQNHREAHREGSCKGEAKIYLPSPKKPVSLPLSSPATAPAAAAPLRPPPSNSSSLRERLLYPGDLRKGGLCRRSL